MTEVAGAELPPPNEFEVQLSDSIETAWQRGSGTVWTATSALLAAELKLPPSAVGAISVTTDNVVNNRPLSAGLITKPRRVLLILVGDDVGLARQERAIKYLIPLTRHLRTVVLAERAGKIWRARTVISDAEHGEPDLIQAHFPAINRVVTVPDPSDELPLEDEQTTGTEDPVVADVETDPQLQVDSVAAIAEQVVIGLAEEGIVLPDAETLARRCVTALLSGHIILQGPPGTAKSSLARILCRAFTTSNHLVTATADWTTYDVIGGYRPTKDDEGNETLGAFIGCVTQAVRECQFVVSENLAGGQSKQAHWLVIDELNRAEIDKAIGPLYSVLGNDAENEIDLWFDDAEPVLTIPNRFRIIGTLNDVDTAYAYSLSQGLSRRFTFIELPVASSVSPEEIAAVTLKAASWVVDTYPALAKDLTADTLAAKFQGDSPESSARSELVELITFIRSSDDGIGFPLGTAQLVDVMKKLMVNSDPAADLDRAVADLIVPQLASLDSPSLIKIRQRCIESGSTSWTATTSRLKTLINPRSTI